MTVVVSASEAKNNLGSLLTRVRDNAETIIVENRGTPAAAIISISELDMLQELKERARREDALAELRALRAEIEEKQKDMTREEADAIAEEIRRDTIQGLIDKGVIRYKD